MFKSSKSLGYKCLHGQSVIVLERQIGKFSFIDTDMLYWPMGALNLMRIESVTNISEEKKINDLYSNSVC